ncbi:hypothetical protein CBER1_05280 [Cercospora berteroae]|uniref:Uncharacterized protein n=1 Tax=Cercospora berteroae TaxID=357750 RepID=A0A2S6CEB9_9PEZI|nr:hypothetical protein CBER1_05280 [Cercospora berteroae]
MAPPHPRRPKHGGLRTDNRHHPYQERKLPGHETKEDRHKYQITNLNNLQKRNKDELQKAADKSKADEREIEKLRKRADEDDKEIRKLRQQLGTRMSIPPAERQPEIKVTTREQAATEEYAKFQESLIIFGTKAVQEQRLRAEAAEQEVSRLRALGEELETSRAVLQDQVAHFELAMVTSADDYTRSALEAQAKRSISMVQGYQNDVAREKNTVEKLRTTVADRDRALRGSEQKSKDQAIELQYAQTQLAAYKRRAENEREVANEQADLIKRLNKENSRLAKMS